MSQRVRRFASSTVPRLMTLACLAGLCSRAATADESAAAPPEKSAAALTQVFPAGESSPDQRLRSVRKLRDAMHPWTPPGTMAEWKTQSEAIRRRILVSNGLWPMPPKPPLNPTIHGKIDRGDYTVEKVYFTSHPGHYVTGNLYRPKHGKGPYPGVLSPHGHWSQGRFFEARDADVKKQLDTGAETFEAAARSALQARMVQLARMGCVVFHYDMAGYADSQQIAHRSGLADAQAGLWLQNHMGLQTFNSIRALDFLLSLEDVDHERIGVTGASGGGTQTFILGAIDPRPTVAFPAVMVSTAMQGGCVCENASYLRIGLNNVAFAALFAPRPMALSGADDWTIAIETKGLPELRQVYDLHGKRHLIDAHAFPQFPHNYNQVARALMYEWFNRHLKLELEEPIREREFERLTKEEMSVFNEAHPRPKDATSAEQLREYLTDTARAQFAELVPQDASEMKMYREVISGAARILLDEGVPAAEEVSTHTSESEDHNELMIAKAIIGRSDTGERIPMVVLSRTADGKSPVVLWLEDDGKSQLLTDDGSPVAGVRELLAAGASVASIDLLSSGEQVPPTGSKEFGKVDPKYHGYTFGYNRPLLSEHVRDILTAIGYLRKQNRYSSVELAGRGNSGVSALLAASLAGDKVDSVTVELDGFRFAAVESTADPMYLPGALKYGGLPGLAALAAPTPASISGAAEAIDWAPLESACAVADGRLTLQAKSRDRKSLGEDILRQLQKSAAR